jgi:hypothetical protein
VAESKALKERSGAEVLKRGYSDDELAQIYELGRFCLENGDVRRAEAIMFGLNEVAPEFAPAWLGTCCIHTQNKNYDGALHASRQALRADGESIEAMLFLACCLLSTKDFNSAGSYLGEVGERIESGGVDNPNLMRFYRAQLARYQNR